MSTTSLKTQPDGAGAAAKLVGERPGNAGVVSAPVATADARTVPTRRGLCRRMGAEVEDGPLHDLA
jgi:hypothetical protein